MSIIDKLAERHILKAQQEGAFDHLPGAGKPLELEDDSMIPEELRAGYRLLKNAGYLPPELQASRELKEVESLIARAVSEAEKGRLYRRLEMLRRQVSLQRGPAGSLEVEASYYDKLGDRLARDE